MKLEDIKKINKKRGYSYQYISEKSGISLEMIRKIFDGDIKSPTQEILEQLERAFSLEDLPHDRDYGAVSYVREAPVKYGVEKTVQGEYTLEDYYSIPKERRVELIDGVIYDMSSPTTIHQMLGGEISRVLRDYVRSKNGRCIVLTAPTDVQLDCDEHTMLQPDILVVCDRKKVHKKGIFGAPDFIVEILSPSTRKKDQGLKLWKYSNAGVREYWLVDSDRKKVVVYRLEEEELPVIYGFDQKVPVGIFEGEYEVDFGEIYEYIKFLYV